MNVLELKGTLFEALGNVQNEVTLNKILQFVQKTTKEENSDWWNTLPAEIKAEIEAAYEESEQDDLLLSHETVSARYKKTAITFRV